MKNSNLLTKVTGYYEAYYSLNFVQGIISYLERNLNKVKVELTYEYDDDISYFILPLCGGGIFIKEVEIIYACGCIDTLPAKRSYMKGGKFELIDGELVYRIYRQEDCCNCENVAAIKECNKPDSLLQQAVYSHGLATGFKGKKNWKEVLDSFFGVVETAGVGEICCSWKTQCIGGFGIFLTGKVTLACNRDLWSSINKKGDRIFDTYDYEYLENIISHKEDLNLSVWDHTEFFVIPKGFYGFWTKQWFYSAHKNEIDEFIKESRKRMKKEIPLIVVKNRHKN